MEAANCPELAPPRLEQAGPVLIAGLSERFDAAGAAGIPALWQRMGRHIGQMRNQLGAAAYGVMSDFCNDPFSYQYLAGVAVQNDAGLSGEFDTVRIPGGAFTIFEHAGHISTLAATCQAVWTQGLPQSGYQALEAAIWFEKYDADYDPATGLGVIEIWIPVQSGV